VAENIAADLAYDYVYKAWKIAMQYFRFNEP